MILHLENRSDFYWHKGETEPIFNNLQWFSYQIVQENIGEQFYQEIQLKAELNMLHFTHFK